jgi:Lrp/AsnC family transcriptional regulator, regulator for asnA, asnC and gidA
MRKRQGKDKNCIDPVDCEIVRLLQKNGRISNSMIARKIGVSEATVRTRLNRLIRDKIIQIVAVGDPFKLGFGVSGIVRIRVDVKRVDSVIQKLKNIREIWYIALATGSTDIDTEFNVKSLDDLHGLVFEKISKIPGIIQMDTSLIMRFAKRDYEWGAA